MQSALIIALLSVIFVSCGVDIVITAQEPENTTGILFSKDFTVDSSDTGFNGISGSKNYISSSGLVICDPGTSVDLMRNYSLADRTVEMQFEFPGNPVLQFTHNFSGVVFTVDFNRKCLFADDKSFAIDFLNGDREYVISFRKQYQEQSVGIKDVRSGEERSFSFVNDGQGGVGKGSVNNNPSLYEMPHGFLSLSCTSGEVICKKIMVTTPKERLKLLLYGDSITETELYYPSSSFPLSWPQLLFQTIPDCAASGFSGRSIRDIVPIIKDELPCLDVDYVMITIGTNGGNTVDNLSDLIEYLLDKGVRPILNHIPCNEGNTQVGVNEIIDKVRQKYSIPGVDFDKATADENGKVDKNKMFWEDYGPDYIELKHDYWHHPNESGSAAMFDQIRKDIPALFTN